MKQMMPLQCLWRCLSIDDMEGYRVCAVTYPRRNLSGIFSDPVLLPCSPMVFVTRTSCPFPQAQNRLLESGLSWKHEKTGRATLQKQCCRGEARKESELCFSTYFASFSFKSWQLYFPRLSYGPARRLVTWKIHWVRWFEFLTESMGNILEFNKKLIYSSFDLLVANTLKLHIEVCSSWYTDKFSVNPMIQWHPKLESVSTYRISKRPKEAGPDAVFFLLGLTVFAKEY